MTVDLSGVKSTYVAPEDKGLGGTKKFEGGIQAMDEADKKLAALMNSGELSATDLLRAQDLSGTKQLLQNGITTLMKADKDSDETVVRNEG